VLTLVTRPFRLGSPPAQRTPRFGTRASKGRGRGRGLRLAAFRLAIQRVAAATTLRSR